VRTLLHQELRHGRRTLRRLEYRDLMSFKERLEKEQKGFSRWRKAFLFISTFLGKNSSFSGKTLCFQIFVFWGLGFG
jgi:hypothetical protein